MIKQKWERGREGKKEEGRRRRKKKRPFSIAQAFSPEAGHWQPFFHLEKNISTTPDPSSFSVSFMAWGVEGTIVNRSQCCKTGNATPRKGFRACGTDGGNLFLSRHTCEDLRLVRLVHQWSKQNYWVQASQGNKQAKATSAYHTQASVSGGKEKTREAGSWWETSQAEESTHGKLLKTEVEGNEVLKDGEKLGILGPAELSSADEGVWEWGGCAHV